MRPQSGGQKRDATTAARRSIPAVGKLLELLDDVSFPRPILAALVRQKLSSLRLGSDVPELDTILEHIRDEVAHVRRTRLQPLINGTGIILHTNFGRAPLSTHTPRVLSEIACNYNNLEFDLETGGRGRRGAYLESALALLCESEAATVVNNCAAALVLIVRHFTKTKTEVVISRGELVQIGGGFRIGEIIAASGARLHEVGATNRTGLNDYAAAIGPETAFILRVHRSNFFMSGFADAPPNEEIARLARSRRVPFVVDLGSGAVSSENYNLQEGEPTPSETLKKGASLVCFSGDKLFGGPQAGIIAGKKTLIAGLKREPLFRALRCDKLIFAALQTTVDAHLEKRSREVPALGLLQTSLEVLRARGEAVVRQLADLPLKARIVESNGEMGGGTLPRAIIPSLAVELNCQVLSPNELTARLRRNDPAIIAYIFRNRVRLDLRTIFPEQDAIVVAALDRCLTNL